MSGDEASRRQGTDTNDWMGRALAGWTGALASRRVWLSVVLVLLGVFFSALSRRIVWQPDVLQFFSAESGDVRGLRSAALQTGLMNQLRFDVHADSGQPDVLAAAQALGMALRESGDFRSVWTGVDAGTLATAYSRAVVQGPVLLDSGEQAEVEGRANGEALRARLREVKATLSDPDGELLLAQARNDPLDLSKEIAGRLKSLSPGSVREGATIQGGMLVTRDSAGRLHTMIVAEPRSLPSDQRAAGKTVDAAAAAIGKVERENPGIGVWFVGAHRGYVENTRRVKENVAWISALGTLAVAVAIAVYFRRVSTALLCLVPATIGVGVALGIAGALHVELPLILLGFAGLLCGSTTDYGIQMIAECQRLFVAGGGIWNAAIPAAAARRAFGPISMSVATSVTGFAALGLSEAPGLRALGLFVAGATVCIWGITFLILPAYLGPWVVRRQSRRVQSRRSRRWSRAGLAGLAVVFVGATAWFSRAAVHVHFNADGRGLDGSTAAMLADERSMGEVWGELRHRAIVMTRGSTADEALALLQRVDGMLADLQRDGQIAGRVTAAGMLPDQQTAEARAAAWRTYWTPGRRDQLKADLAVAATANGFKAAAFAGYADRVGEVAAAPAEERVANSPAALFPGFVDVEGGGKSVVVATIVQMRSDKPPRLETGWGQELRLRFPESSGVTLISGDMLLFDATDRARAEAERLAPWCLLAILLPLWVYFRGLRRAWLAMVCLGVGFLWVLGAAELFASGLNLLSLVPVLFTLGVAVDYGIYAASDPAWEGAAAGVRQNRNGSTFVCALTTILGAGSLVCASHPALRWLGITLVAGISGGYLTSLLVVSPFMRWRSGAFGKRRTGVWRFGRVAVTLLLVALTLLLAIPPVVQLSLDQQHPAGVGPHHKMMHAEEVAPRVYRSGKSWMRWRETSPTAGMWEMAITGTAASRGQALAALASPVDVRIENEMLDQLDYFLPGEWSRWLVLRGVAANLMSLPRYVGTDEKQEIYAAATSYPDPHAYLAPSYPRILSYHALHDVSQMLIDNPLIVPNTFACTGVVSLPRYTASDAASGHLLLGRVFDFEGGESFGRQKSVTYVIPPAGEGIPFAHVAWPGLAGCVTGMNAERLALFINAAATKDYRRIGTPTILMAREVLQHARTLDDAERIIRSTQVFVSDIVVVADGKSGAARVFEKSPTATAAYEIGSGGAGGEDGSAVVTNHLVTPRFADDPVNVERKRDGTTLQRYGRARQLLDGLKQHVSVVDLATLLRDKRGPAGKKLGMGNRNAIDGLIACHGVIIDVTAGQMWVAGWPNVEGKFIGFDVIAMLKEAGGHPEFLASASPAELPADTIMENGGWERVLAARDAASKADKALLTGDAATATALAREVLQANPEFYLGHELLGRALFLSGDRRGAAEALHEAVLLDPPYAGHRAAIQGLIEQCETH